MEIDELTSEARCTYTMHVLWESIWPGGRLRTEPAPVKTEEQLLATKQKVLGDLINFFPGMTQMYITGLSLDCHHIPSTRTLETFVASCGLISFFLYFQHRFRLSVTQKFVPTRKNGTTTQSKLISAVTYIKKC